MHDTTAHLRDAVQTVARAFYAAESDDESATTGQPRPPWEQLDEAEKWVCTHDARLAVNALAAEGRLATEPVAYVIFSSLTFTTPGPMRNVHVRLTRAEADDVLDMLEDRAAANPRAWPGVKYMIGGIHAVARTAPQDPTVESSTRPPMSLVAAPDTFGAEPRR